jgi:hypothetical protein
MSDVGRILRMGGLLIEVLGAMAVLAGNSGHAAFRVRIAGGASFLWGWPIAVTGFVIWLVGTATVYRSRSGR